MWHLLRTRRWISFTLTALIAIVAFGFLSRWQFQRAAEESAASSIVTTNASAAPVGLDSVLAADEQLDPADEWRAVTVAGLLRCAEGALVRNRPLDTANGLWAACPLITEDGTTVWVNRGWMPAGNAATQSVPMPEWPVGEVSATGRLRLSEEGPAEQPGDLPAGQVTHLDTAALGAAAGTASVYDPYLEITAMEPSDPGGLRSLPLVYDDGYQNISYAMQWLIFASIAVGGWFYFLRREAREMVAEIPVHEPADHS